MTFRYNALVLGVMTVITTSLMTDTLFAQIQEPELREVETVRTPFSEGYRAGIGFNTVINNFGFGIGVEYKRMLSPQMELVSTFRWTGLRDVREQTFTDIFFGGQTIPNKYQRAFALPMIIGLRQRLFAEQVTDEFRFYVNAAAGPVVSFSYPYFNDRNGNGYREQFQQRYEEVYDVFSGLKDTKWHLGLAGELKFSLDVGQNFSRLTTIQFGYLFYYFGNGIQMMQPNQPIPRNPTSENPFPFEVQPEGCTSLTTDCELVMQPFFPSQKFFGTPQISLVFGRMW